MPLSCPPRSVHRRVRKLGRSAGLLSFAGTPASGEIAPKAHATIPTIEGRREGPLPLSDRPCRIPRRTGRRPAEGAPAHRRDGPDRAAAGQGSWRRAVPRTVRLAGAPSRAPAGSDPRRRRGVGAPCNSRSSPLMRSNSANAQRSSVLDERLIDRGKSLRDLADLAQSFSP